MTQIEIKKITNKLIFARASARDIDIFIPTSAQITKFGRASSTGLMFWFGVSIFILSVAVLSADPGHIANLSSQNEIDRAKAAIALGQEKDELAVSSLVSRLSGETSKKVKLYILQALIDIGTEDAVQGIENGFLDSDPDVRIKAARGLKNFEGLRSDQALTNALNDSDPYVRAAAATSLGGDNSKTVLIQLSHSEDSKLRSQALLGLASIHASGLDVTAAIENGLESSDESIKAAAMWAAEVLNLDGGL